MAQSDKHEVEIKTVPGLRAETDTDNSKVFEHSYTVQHRGKPSADLDERNAVGVRLEAVNRGLIPTGDVKRTKVEKVNENTDRIVYQVPVRLNGDAGTEGVVAVSEQPDDTQAETPPVRKSKTTKES